MATVLMRIKVKPKARNSELVQIPDGTWLAKVKSPPVDGKANEELVALVAEHFRCRKAAVSIKSGAAGRMKLVKVEAPWVRFCLGCGLTTRSGLRCVRFVYSLHRVVIGS